MRKSSSLELLPHTFWRKLRRLIPGRLWSFLYSVRERLGSRRRIRALEATLYANAKKSGKNQHGYGPILKESWIRHDAVGKAQSGYAEHYAALLDCPPPGGFRNILEIGVFNGGGHRAWSEVFPQANVYGFDIDPSTQMSEGKIQTFIGDQLSDASLKSISEELPASFDLIIDDGWHQPEAAFNSMRHFLPLLNKQGYYIVEDIDWGKYRKVWLRAQQALDKFFFTSFVRVQSDAAKKAVGGSYGIFLVRSR